MACFLGSIIDGFELLEYDYENSLDYTFFKMGISLEGIKDKLIYRVKSVGAVEEIKKAHFLACLGPYLVSGEFKDLLEIEAPGEAEFYKVEFSIGEDTIVDCSMDFYILNTLVRNGFCDMDNSIYKVTNFDPLDPKYWFDYRVLLEDALGDINIATCSQSNRVVVSDKIMQACVDSKLAGLEFCKSVDFTHANKTECFVI